MKKGFTLVEIIISVALVLIIGTSVSFIVINKSDKKIENANNQILEASSLYAKTEIDSEGKSFYEQILTGAKGVQIPLNNLVDKGYIDESVANIIYDENDLLEDDKDYYVLLALDHDYCDDGTTIIMLSWMNQGKEVYLCNNVTETEDIVTINENETAKIRLSMDKFAVSKEYYDSITDENKDNYLTYEENGVFNYYNESLDIVYSYYRGAVDNNYLKLGKDSEGNDLYWRILWKNSDNKMKIVLDEEVPLYIINDITLEKYPITLNSNNKMYYFRIKGYSYTYYYFINPDISYEKNTSNSGDKTYYYTYNIQSKDYFNNFIDLGLSPYSNNWYYDEQNTLWYESTNLKDYSFVLKESNFCVNDCKKYNQTLRYYAPSTDFDCKYGVESEGTCDYDETKYVSSIVGYLSYADLIRAGIPAKSSESLLESGNFLINSENQILLSDLYMNDLSSNYFKSNYYFSDKGLSNAQIADYSQGSSYCGSTRCVDYYYTLNKIDESSTTTLANSIFDYSSNLRQKESFFVGNVLKPVIVLNMNDIKLSKSKGTKENPYTIIT